MEKLKYIINELNNIKPSNKYVSEAVKDRIKYYNETANMLKNVSFEKIQRFSFLSEVLQKAENLEKLNFVPILLDKVQMLEVHKYAPELNRLHFKSRHVNVPQAKTIADAITQVINNSSLTSLNDLMYELN